MMLHNDCNTCVAQNLTSNSSSMDYIYLKNYPTISELTATKMRPKEVTFRVLKDTMDLAGDKMREGIWSERK